MITFIFSIGQQRRDGDVPRQVSSLTKLRGDIDEATSSLPCPKHGLNSGASILLSGFYYGSRWEILDACCEEFRDAIEAAVSAVPKGAE
jgi:hypothetical protein